MPDLIGQSLGRYRILQQLGEGGMAIVYKAYDTQMEREVAVKVIRTDAFAPGQMTLILKRFKREARVLAGLTHPNIVRVLDSGEQDSIPYLAMEYIVGGSLKDMLDARHGKPFPWQEAAQLIAPIARALEAAHQHEAKIVHRDVKPSNILINQYGMPMLTDFGIAKVLENAETFELTASGIGIGTPDYMAPEQGSAKSVDHRADIYALGVVLFEMVTGQKPYHADTPMAVMIMKATEPLPRPTKLVPGLPLAVEYILLKALARNPQDRYATMGDFAYELECLAEGKLPTITLTAESAAEKAPRRVWRPVAIGLGICVVAAAGVGIFKLLPANLPPSPTTVPEQTRTVVIPSATVLIPVSMKVGSPTADVPAPATRDNASLVYIPQGKFLMGSNSDEPYWWGAESPKHTVTLDAFWIYKEEVTNSMYHACVSDGTCPQPVELSSRTHPDYFGNPEFDNYPVIHVTHANAVSYCTWAGARLPTEAEWEKAARGEEGDLFPWGNEELQNDFANFCDQNCPDPDPTAFESGFDDGYPDVAPVGSYAAGASPYGALDMAGNVLEWVSDWYSQDYYANSPSDNPRGPESGTKHIIRGGSWWSGRDGLRPAARASKSINYSSDKVGFRCAVDAP